MKRELNKIVSGLRVSGEDTPAQVWARQGYGCTLCDGYGNLVTDDGACFCECILAYFRKKRVEECNISADRFTAQTLQSYKPDGVISRENWALICRYAEEYSVNNDRGLVLWGNNGLGKSHVAVALTYRLLQHGVSVVFTSTKKMFHEIRKTFDKNSEETEYNVTRYYLSPNILVLDELVIGTGWERKKLEEMVDERYENTGGDHGQSRYALIITTNLCLVPRPGSRFTGLLDEAGPRIESRLREMCHWIEFTGEDHRGKNKTEKETV